MLGFQTSFIATLGTSLDSVERGGKQRHSLRAAVRMPKPSKDATEYGTAWVSLNISDFNAEYVRTNGIVGSRAVVFGRMRTNEKDGKTFFDVDVSDITIMPRGEKAGAKDAGGPDW